MRCFLFLFSGLLAIAGAQDNPADVSEPTNRVAEIVNILERPKETNIFEILHVPLPPELERTRSRALESQSEEAAADFLYVGEFDKALDAYRAMGERAKQRAPNRCGLAMALFQLGEVKEAEAVFLGLVREFPQEPIFHNNLAWLYATADDIRFRRSRDALHHARQALLFAPREPRVWNTLAEAYFVGREYEKAVEAAEQAVELASRDIVSQDYLPDLRASLAKYKTATKVIGILRE